MSRRCCAAVARATLRSGICAASLPPPLPRERSAISRPMRRCTGAMSPLSPRSRRAEPSLLERHLLHVEIHLGGVQHIALHLLADRAHLQDGVDEDPGCVVEDLLLDLAIEREALLGISLGHRLVEELVGFRVAVAGRVADWNALRVEEL